MTTRNHSVERVVIAGVEGFQVQALYRDCSDSFWEVVAHAAVFTERERAERLMARIKAKAWWEYGSVKVAGFPERQWGVPVNAFATRSCAVQETVAAYCPLLSLQP